MMSRFVMADQFQRQLESFTKALDAFKASLDEYAEAVRKAQQADNYQRKQEFPPASRSDSCFPVAIREYYEAEQRERNSPWKRIKPGLEVLGFVTAVGLVALTYLTFREVDSQARSAQAQVAIMQRQLEAADRPWIKINGTSLLEDLTFFKTSGPGDPTLKIQGNTAVAVAVENVGHSVARNVFLRGELVFAGVVQAMLEQDRICSGQVETLPVGRQSIFPDERYEFTSWALGETPIKDEGKKHTPTFVGCVIYQISNSGATHHSAFVFKLEQLAPGAHWTDKPFPHTTDLFEVGTRVSKENVHLGAAEPSPWLRFTRSSFDAN